MSRSGGVTQARMLALPGSKQVEEMGWDGMDDTCPCLSCLALARLSEMNPSVFWS